MRLELPRVDQPRPGWGGIEIHPGPSQDQEIVHRQSRDLRHSACIFP